MHIVLFEPQIPPNTGNVARTCAATSTTLHLVEPLGFRIDDRALKRAGLDYWHLVDVRLHASLEEVIQEAVEARARCFFYTKFADKRYTEVDYKAEDYLIFGKETTGLPALVHEKYPESRLRLPMGEGLRSLNLSNTVAIVLYEGLRQLNFPGMA